MKFSLQKAKDWLPIGIFSFLMLFITTAFFHSLVLGDSSEPFVGKKDREGLSQGKILATTFTARQDNLQALKFHLGNMSALPGEKLVFELRDADCLTTLVRKEKYWLWPAAPVYTIFSFSSIKDSQGKTYCAAVEYVSPYQRRGKNLPYLHLNKSEDSWYKNLTNGQEKKGALHIKTAYSDGILNDTSQLLKRISQYKPIRVKGLPLLTLFLLVPLAALVLGISILNKKEKNPPEE